MSQSEILAGYRHMVKAIAPELERLYIIEQPDVWQSPARCDAYCIYPHPTAIMRDFLIDNNQWIGPGPIIIFTAPLDDSPEMQAIFVHELAHALPRPPVIFDIEPSEIERQLQAAHFSSFTSPDFGTHAPRWDGHGLFFIRRALHLFMRCVNSGWLINLNDLGVAGKHYHLSDARLYFQALGDEPDRLRHLNFSQIQKVKPPREFTRLWWSDTTKGHR